VKIAVVTWGSRGDFQPYLALAVALKRAGHHVRLGTQPLPGFAGLAAEWGIELVELASPAGDQYNRTANTAIGLGDPVRAVRLILDDLYLPAFDSTYGACLELASWADVVVSHFLQIAGPLAAASAGKPWVTGTLVPTQIATGARLPGQLRGLGGGLNAAAWKAAIRYMNRAWLPPVNAARSRVGMPPLNDVASRGFYSPDLNLVAASPVVAPRPPDWPANHRMTGFWLLDTPSSWQPPRELAAFLSSDPPPVAIGFGSMTSADAGGFTGKVVEAVRLAGVRAVVEPGLAKLIDLPEDDQFLPTGAPHAWLLPRVAALVHHGGLGTAAAALHAGIPSVFVPHVFDQFAWARRARALGVAPRAVPAKDLDPERLAGAITSAVEDRSIRENAQVLAGRLSGDGGAGLAVRVLEELGARGFPQARAAAG